MEVTNFIGETGYYQNLMLALSMYRGIMLAINNLCTSFVFPKVDHWCARLPDYTYWSPEEWRAEAIPQTESGEYHQCERYALTKRGEIDLSSVVPCDAWEYDRSQFWPSGTEQWNLVCDWAWWNAMPQTIYMIGMTVGFIIMGRVSDVVGRRPVLLGGIVSYVILEYSMSLAASFTLFCVLRFLNAVAVAAANNSLTLYVECIGPSYRGRSMVAYGLFWGVGIVVLAGLAAVLPGWQYQLMAYATMYALPLLLWSYIVESPKWLLTAGKYEEAQQAIRKIALFNGRPDMSEQEFATLKDHYKEQQRTQEANSGSGIKALCKSKKMIMFTLTNVVFQFCTAIVRYQMAMDTGLLPLSPYMNFVIGGVIEAASGIASYALLLYMRRKPSTICFLLFTTAAYVVHACVPSENAMAERLTMMVGRLCIGNVININIIYLSEMFPTSARALALGFAQTVFGIGAALQPLINHPFGNPTGDALFCAVIMLLATAAVFAWPETKDRPLPDFVADAAGSSRPSNESVGSELHSFDRPNSPDFDMPAAVRRVGAVAAAVASPNGADVVVSGKSSSPL